MSPEQMNMLSTELFALFRKHNPSNFDALGVCFSMACVCANDMGMSKLDAQKLFVRLWDEGGKDPEIAAYKKAHLA
jgi:hypothetical protein